MGSAPSPARVQQPCCTLCVPPCAKCAHVGGHLRDQFAQVGRRWCALPCAHGRRPLAQRPLASARRDVCIAIGSIATLDLPMVVDLIGIYGLKGPYCTLTTTNWFLQALSVIPRGSWGDVARRSYHDPMGKVRNCDPGATMVVGPRLAVSLNH
ncbi:hypothetical protein F511_35327 [Dorcoceras hygrometricum]|uniref:Helicase domain-containing family protein n=1 Tax=Dorcoceras hygrometricum TaxID=472368 RepID=A0A2Z7C8D4_9LAMI|nr:hypothetical protein F511_35327 [Dorcoceras hygrometricum]